MRLIDISRAAKLLDLSEELADHGLEMHADGNYWFEIRPVGINRPPHFVHDGKGRLILKTTQADAASNAHTPRRRQCQQEAI
jgi:hypothetical protein